MILYILLEDAEERERENRRRDYDLYWNTFHEVCNMSAILCT